MVRPDAMACAGQGLKRQQVEAVQTRMALRQEAVVGVLALLQLGVTRIDLHYGLSYGAVTLIPSQPPPAVAIMRGGNERDMTAGVSSHQLTTEATPGQVSAPGDRGPRQQFGAPDAGVCSAARLRGPHPSGICSPGHRLEDSPDDASLTAPIRLVSCARTLTGFD